jgi:tetratricopeptide (TPR) repeat protein
VLLANGTITRAQLADALRQQRARKLQRAFRLSPRATFAFYAEVDFIGGRPDDVPATDPLPSVWRGVRATPPTEHIRATIATIAGRPLRIHGSIDLLAPKTGVRVAGESMGFDPRETAAVRMLAESTLTVSEMVMRTGLDASNADLLAYFLVIAKLAQITERRTAAPVEGRPRTNPSLGASMTTGEYTRRVSFTMRAVREDASPLVIPSPIPGTVSTTPRPAVTANKRPTLPGLKAPDLSDADAQRRETRPIMPAAMPSEPARRETRPVMPQMAQASTKRPISGVKGLVEEDRPRAEAGRDREDTSEAEHLVSDAEMYFVLGEREKAVGLARKALGVAPGFPAVMAFLAYLEAMGTNDGQDSYLRDLLLMADSALQKDPSCRRGHFYRAEIKKRLGDHDGAIRDLRTAVRQDPNDTEPKRELSIYERKVREGAIALRSMSPFAGTPRPQGIVDRFFGKKGE